MAFKPKRLSRRSVEAPMQPRWRVMGPEEERRLHRRAIEQHARFAPFGPRRRRRLARYAIGTGLGFAAIGFLFVAGDLRTFWTHLLVGIPLGAVVAWTYPGDFATGLLYAAAGFGATAWRMAPLGGLRAVLFGCIAAVLMGCIGIALGRAEANKRLDLEE